VPREGAIGRSRTRHGAGTPGGGGKGRRGAGGQQDGHGQSDHGQQQASTVQVHVCPQKRKEKEVAANQSGLTAWPGPPRRFLSCPAGLPPSHTRGPINVTRLAGFFSFGGKKLHCRSFWKEEQMGAMAEGRHAREGPWPALERVPPPGWPISPEPCVRASSCQGGGIGKARMPW